MFTSLVRFLLTLIAPYRLATFVVAIVYKLLRTVIFISLVHHLLTVIAAHRVATMVVATNVAATPTITTVAAAAAS